MQNHLFGKSCAVLALLTALLLQQSFAQTTATAVDSAITAAPTITAQPVSQTAEYGGNVSFAVGATGVGLQYQWRKNGVDLADYVNVSGAKTSTLQLVGVAQIDAADYTVVISNGAGAVTSAVARLTVNSIIVFSDNFESGNLKNWTAFSELPGLAAALKQTASEKKLNPVSLGSLSPKATRLAISNRKNHSGNGANSAWVNSSLQRMYHNLGVELAGPMRATFWIYDDDGPQYRAYGEVRGYSGAGHGIYTFPSGMKQLFAIGRYTTDFGTNNQAGAFAAEKVNPKKYQARVERGKNRGWFNLDGAPDRSPGWHKFQLERDANGTTVRFYVDDVLGRTVTGADHILIDCVTIGSAGIGSGVGDAWFDDVAVEAYPWRYDWQSKDSQGKGLFDWMRLRETGDDPRVTDVRYTTIAELPGKNFSKILGNWGSRGNGICAQDIRGAVEYQFTTAAPDAYRIEIEGGERAGKYPIVKLSLNISIDGEDLGRFVLPYNGLTNGFVHCFTPFITPGQHTIRVYWDNAQNKCALYLHAIRLQSLDGSDLNGNGFKDWVENRVMSQSGMDPVPRSSQVSPLCIEGRGEEVPWMQCKVGQSENVPIHPGAGHRWYANVPLSPSGAVKIDVSYQNGVLHEGAEVKWDVTNLLLARDTTIRKGDALLLNAAPSDATSGQVSISINGVSTYTTDVATPVVHRFDQTGTFVVTGTYLPTGAQGTMTVKVVDASLGDSVAAWVGKRRTVSLDGLPAEAVVEADPRLTFTRVQGQEYNLTVDAAEPRTIVARLGQNGPILGSTTVEGFRLFNWYDTYLRYVKIHDDGSQTIEEAYIASPKLPNITVVVQIIVSGVTFDDGSVTKILKPEDFDDLGICRVRYIRDDGVKTSVCHSTKVYQNGTLVGWPAYEK